MKPSTCQRIINVEPASFRRPSASNWPLRGEKRTLFEGGTRVASFAWSADLEKPRRVENGLIHLVDWLPTFVRYAGRLERFPATFTRTDISLFDQILSELPSI